MCGINGLFSIGNALPGETPSLIRNMNAALAHRGPDDEGAFTDLPAGIALGHRRLSIIDLSANGHQPMTDAAGNALVFNGEIYNYRELKHVSTKEMFHSNSDTEVLLSLLSRKGPEAMHDLNGMFAFAFYNKATGELLLARARL